MRPVWESVLVAAVSLLVGVLGTVSLFVGRLTRLEARCDGSDATHGRTSEAIERIEAAQGRTLALMYRLAAKSGIEVH